MIFHHISLGKVHLAKNLSRNLIIFDPIRWIYSLFSRYLVGFQDSVQMGTVTFFQVGCRQGSHHDFSPKQGQGDEGGENLEDEPLGPKITKMINK